MTAVTDREQASRLLQCFPKETREQDTNPVSNLVYGSQVLDRVVEALLADKYRTDPKITTALIGLTQAQESMKLAIKNDKPQQTDIEHNNYTNGVRNAKKQILSPFNLTERRGTKKKVNTTKILIRMAECLHQPYDLDPTFKGQPTKKEVSDATKKVGKELGLTPKTIKDTWGAHKKRISST